MVHGTYSSKCLFKVHQSALETGLVLYRIMEVGEKFFEEGEEGAIFKVQQEELRDEKHGTVARCVCTGYHGTHLFTQHLSKG